MRKPQLLFALAAAVALLALASPAGAAPGVLDYDVPGGHFFTQTNGGPLGSSPTGYSVTNEGGIPFWDE
ncbi:MAG: hypothetical protein M1582_00870, partial [Actinobacteria bacterium]|nr:hypothetical protein [Actinomycetota bacterium]